MSKITFLNLSLNQYRDCGFFRFSVLISVKLQKLLHNLITANLVVITHTPLTISPQSFCWRRWAEDWASSESSIVFFSWIISSIRHTDRLCNCFLELVPDLDTALAIIDQFASKASETIWSANSATYIADEQLDYHVDYRQHCVDDRWYPWVDRERYNSTEGYYVLDDK